MKKLLPLRFLIIAIMLAGWALCASAQELVLDTLLTEQSKYDTTWFSTIHGKSVEKSRLTGEETGGIYAREMLRRASQQQDTLQMGRAQQALGYYYFMDNEFDSAAFYFLSAGKIAVGLGDQQLLSSVHVDLATLHYVWGDYEQSISEMLKALEVLNTTGIGDKLAIYGQLATSYSSYMPDQDSAQKYFQMAENLMKQLPEPNLDQVKGVYNNRGASYFFKGEYEKAVWYYKKGLEVSMQKPAGAEGIAIDLINIGEAYGYMGQFQESFKYLNDGLALARRTQDSHVALSALSMLSDIYERKGDKTKALEFHKSFVMLKDSLFSIEKARQITAMQTRYETEKKQNEILLLTQEKQTAGIELDKQKNRNLLLGSFTLFFLLISGLTVVGYLKVKKANSEVKARNETITKINKALSKSQDALIASNDTKDKFFALVAHDLRGPVTSLQGIGRMLSYYNRKGDENRINELISHIDQSTQSVNHLLDNLLKWALSHTDGLRFQPEAIELSGLVEECKTIFDEVVKAKEIELQIQREQVTWVEADYNMISTVLRNLLSNAIKFSPVGGVVTLQILRSEEFLEVTVSDSGEGISQETVDQIKAGMPVESTRGTQDEKGTGLGLTLCQEFVKLHDSQLHITRRETGGTSISFQLPVLQEAVAGASDR